MILLVQILRKFNHFLNTFMRNTYVKKILKVGSPVTSKSHDEDLFTDAVFARCQEVLCSACEQKMRILREKVPIKSKKPLKINPELSSPYFSEKRHFFKNQLMSFLYLCGTLSCVQKIRKTNEPSKLMFLIYGRYTICSTEALLTNISFKIDQLNVIL